MFEPESRELRRVNVLGDGSNRKNCAVGQCRSSASVYSPRLAPTSRMTGEDLPSDLSTVHTALISPLLLTLAPEPSPWEPRNSSTSFKVK